MGIKKLESKLNILKEHNLVVFGQERNEKGQFSRFTLDIYDTDAPFEVPENAPQPVGHFDRTAKTVGRLREATKEEETKEELQTTKSSCTNVQKRFNEFYDVYPRKQQRKAAEKAWQKNKLDSKADEIIKKVKEQIADDVQWQTNQFVPLPATYLNNERWLDEIISNKEIKNAIPKNKAEKYFEGTKRILTDIVNGNAEWSDTQTMPNENRSTRSVSPLSTDLPQLMDKSNS